MNDQGYDATHLRELMALIKILMTTKPLQKPEPFPDRSCLACEYLRNYCKRCHDSHDSFDPCLSSFMDDLVGVLPIQRYYYRSGSLVHTCKEYRKMKTNPTEEVKPIQECTPSPIHEMLIWLLYRANTGHPAARENSDREEYWANELTSTLKELDDEFRKQSNLSPGFELYLDGWLNWMLPGRSPKWKSREHFFSSHKDVDQARSRLENR